MKDPRTPCLGVQRKNNQKTHKIPESQIFQLCPPPLQKRLRGTRKRKGELAKVATDGKSGDGEGYESNRQSFLKPVKVIIYTI